MKKLKLNLQQIDGAEVLTRSQLKKIMGGVMNGGSELCMGCDPKNDACASVGKGSCQYYSDCNGGVYYCSGWTSC